MIYRLSSDYDGLAGAYVSEVGEHPYPGLCLMGEALDAESIELPLQFEIKGGNPSPVLWEYIDNRHLMSQKLLEAVLSAGVTNIEVFPAVIRSKDGRWSTQEYVAVNVTGGIHSVFKVNGSSLIVDPSMIPDLQLFLCRHRQLVCNEAVAKAIQNYKARGVLLTPH